MITKETKQNIDKWFTKRTPEEVNYIFKEYKDSSKQTLREYLNYTYGNQKGFYEKVGVSQALCSYWCKTKWEDLTKTTREKIKGLLGVDIEFY